MINLPGEEEASRFGGCVACMSTFCGVTSLVYLHYEESVESEHDEINKMTRAPSEDSDQPGHPPSLIRVFAVRMKKNWVLSYP